MMDVTKKTLFNDFVKALGREGFKRDMAELNVSFVKTLNPETGERLVLWNCDDFGLGWRLSYHKSFDDECGRAFRDLGSDLANVAHIVCAWSAEELINALCKEEEEGASQEASQEVDEDEPLSEEEAVAEDWWHGYNARVEAANAFADPDPGDSEEAGVPMEQFLKEVLLERAEKLGAELEAFKRHILAGEYGSAENALESLEVLSAKLRIKVSDTGEYVKGAGASPEAL